MEPKLFQCSSRTTLPLLQVRAGLTALAVALTGGCAMEGPHVLKVEPMSVVRHGMARAQALYLLGRQHQRMGALDKAEPAYLQAVSIDSSMTAAYVALGVLYAERGEMDRSVEKFLEANRLNPNAAYIWNNLGFAYYKSGRYAEAEEALRRALGLEPGNKFAKHNLNRVALAQKESPATATAENRRTRTKPSVARDVKQAHESKVASDALRSIATSGVSPRSDRAGANGELPRGERNHHAVVLSGARVIPLPIGTPINSEPIPSAASELQAHVVRLAPNVYELRIPPAFAKRRDMLPAAPIAHSAPIRIEVVNGNGIFRFARDTAAFLKSAGIVTVRTLDKPPFRDDKTEIHYRQGFVAAAQRLREYLGDKPLLKEVADLAPEIAARILLGRDSTPKSLLVASNLERSKPVVAAAVPSNAVVR